MENSTLMEPVRIGKSETSIGIKRKIIYLINPFSGTKNKEAFAKIVHAANVQRGLDFDIVTTSPPTGNYDFLIDRIREEKITDIIIIGGDGTVSHALSELRHEKVHFGIIPFGSGNGLAFAAGIPRSQKQALEMLLDNKCKPQNVDAFYVNGKFACMLSGIGFDAQVAHDFAAKASRGLLTYTQQSIINYFKAQPYQFEVEVDGFSFFTEAFFISVANGNQFGNNFKIAPEADLNDGMLDVVIVQKMNKAKLPFAILKQIRGNNKLEKIVDDVLHKNILYFRTPSLKVRNMKLAPLHIDGEPCDTEQELDFTIEKSCFKIYFPS